MKTVAHAAFTDPASVPRPRYPLDQVRDRIRVKHCAPRTEHAYVDWIKRYILYFGKQHSAARALGRVPQGAQQAGSDYMHLMT